MIRVLEQKIKEAEKQKKMEIGVGSSKRIGKYYISIKGWDVTLLIIKREGERMPLYKKQFSLRSAITLYKRLDSVGKVESFLER